MFQKCNKPGERGGDRARLRRTVTSPEPGHTHRLHRRRPKVNTNIFLVRAVICPPQLSDVRWPLRVFSEIKHGGLLCARPAFRPRTLRAAWLHAQPLACLVALLPCMIGCPAARLRATAHAIFAASYRPYEPRDFVLFAPVRCGRPITEQLMAPFECEMPAAR